MRIIVLLLKLFDYLIKTYVKLSKFPKVYLTECNCRYACGRFKIAPCTEALATLNTTGLTVFTTLSYCVLSKCKEYYRSDSFPFDYEPN